MKRSLSGIFFLVLMVTGHYGMSQVLVTVIQNNRNCEIPDGTASASVGGDTEGYTFDWYDAGFNYITSGNVVSNFSAGNYIVVGLDGMGTITVGTVHFTILDEIVLPVVSLESTANTSCVATGNGALITIVNGNPSDYSYAWYEGADPQGSFISSAMNLFDRPAGSYTLTVTHLITRCYTTVSGQIVDDLAIPVVNVVATNNTNCTTPNGTLNAVTEEAAQQYSFAWYTIDLTPLGVTTPLIEHLAAGNYVVSVTDGVTGCATSATGVIIDNCTAESRPGFSAFAGDVTNPKKEASNIGYYPNPASGTLYVSSTGPAELALINHNGEVVLRKNVYLTDTAFALDLSGIKPGKYILKANEAGTITNFQIVIKK
jgi:hypothetical protein